MSHRRDAGSFYNQDEFCRTDDDNNAIFAVLSQHIGRVVTIFTQSGGESGKGFTGLLIEVNRNLALLVTTPPSFEGQVCRCRSGCRDKYITAHTIIPLSKIVSITYTIL